VSTIKSSAENLTLNADGSGNDIIFQSNGSNVATLDQAGLLTATTFSGTGATPSISDGGNATAITIDASESVGMGHSTGFGTYSGTGVKYAKGDGTLFVGRDGGCGLFVNRETDQGDMIALNVAGSSKVKIGTDSDALFFGTGTGGNTKQLIITSDGEVTMPSQPAFLAIAASNQNNIAINTAVTVVLGTETFDQGSDFASNTFTAPVTGKYQLNVCLRLQNIDQSADYLYTKIITSNRNHTMIHDHGMWSSDPQYWSSTNSALADMDAGDTAYVQLYQAGGAAQMDIQGSSDGHTYFSGFLVC